MTDIRDRGCGHSIEESDHHVTSNLIPYGLSTTCLHSMSLEEKFATTKELGFDGIEVLVTHSTDSRSEGRLRELSAKYELPILSIHAPTLVLTHFVWGPRPYQKLQRAAAHAAEVGAETVVVHPPYKLQRDYAQLFLDAVRKVNSEHGVHIAVENMYPWYAGNHSIYPYAPDWHSITENAGAASLTFDFSHATVAGLDIVAEVKRIAPRLRHIHLSDANVGSKVDTHLVPGRGDLPLAEAFDTLRRANWEGAVVAEINTLRNLSRKSQLAALQEVHDRGRELLAGQG
jgi:sugar phosphate isomerase/epimerase